MGCRQAGLSKVGSSTWADASLAGLKQTSNARGVTNPRETWRSISSRSAKAAAGSVLIFIKQLDQLGEIGEGAGEAFGWTKCALRHASMPTIVGGSFLNVSASANRLIFRRSAIFPSASKPTI